MSKSGHESSINDRSKPLSFLCKKTCVKVPTKRSESSDGSQAMEELAVSPSKIFKPILLTGLTALSIDCGGPGGFSLNAPPPPEVPILQKDRDDQCAVASTKSKDNSNDEELELLAASKVGYREKIRAYLNDKCVNCHGADGAAPDLSTFAGAKRAAKLSLAALRDDSMPPDNPASDAEKETFAAWVSGGLLETVSSSCDATKKTKTKKTTVQDSDANSRPTTPVNIPPPASGPAPSPSPRPSPTPAPAPRPSPLPSQGPGPGAGPAPAPSPAPGGTVTYRTVVKPYLDSKCGSCHGRAPVLTSYSAAKSAATESLNSMKAGRMPPGSRPSQTEINNLQSWITAGYPE